MIKENITYLIVSIHKTVYTTHMWKYTTSIKHSVPLEQLKEELTGNDLNKYEMFNGTATDWNNNKRHLYGNILPQALAVISSCDYVSIEQTLIEDIDNHFIIKSTTNSIFTDKLNIEYIIACNHSCILFDISYKYKDHEDDMLFKISRYIIEVALQAIVNKHIKRLSKILLIHKENPSI